MIAAEMGLNQQMRRRAMQISERGTVKPTSLTGKTTALLVYHFTDELTRPGRGFEQSVVDGLPAFARLLAGCRSAGVLVTYMMLERAIAIGSQIIPEVAPLTDEPIVRHTNRSALNCPEFVRLLLDHERDTLLISGYALDRGLSDTARQAGGWDSQPIGERWEALDEAAKHAGETKLPRPIVVRDACFTYDVADSPVGHVSRQEIERAHLAALHRHGIPVMSIDEVIAALG
ncbi:MAG: hypothetical protein HW416_14 [Chloroflexi bacterium]|nr:hypothetical protein [Chloroflexota bacterium]